MLLATHSAFFLAIKAFLRTELMLILNINL